MADISSELETLISTRYGSEMKSSILSAINKIYEEKRAEWYDDDEEEDEEDGQEED